MSLNIPTTNEQYLNSLRIAQEYAYEGETQLCEGCGETVFLDSMHSEHVFLNCGTLLCEVCASEPVAA